MTSAYAPDLGDSGEEGRVVAVPGANTRSGQSDVSHAGVTQITGHFLRGNQTAESLLTTLARWSAFYDRASIHQERNPLEISHLSGFIGQRPLAFRCARQPVRVLAERPAAGSELAIGTRSQSGDTPVK